MLKIAALVALAVWCFTVGPSLVLGLGAPARTCRGVGHLAGADVRPPAQMPWLIGAEVVVSGLATATVAAAGYQRVAVALGVLAAVSLALAVSLANS